MDMRKVEKRVDEAWEVTTIQELHRGDIFRMFESTGEPVKGPTGETEFLASDEPYQSTQKTTSGETVSGVWTINTVPNPGF